MREQRGDIFSVPTDALVITTNGATRKDGAGVMGRGVALQARSRFEGLEFDLGDKIRERGNHVAILRRLLYPLNMHPARQQSCLLVSLPVKKHWRETASGTLIVRSLQELRQLADDFAWGTVTLPRPGCGNGGLSWVVVKPLCERYLPDSRFVIVERGHVT